MTQHVEDSLKGFILSRQGEIVPDKNSLKKVKKIGHKNTKKNKKTLDKNRAKVYER